MSLDYDKIKKQEEESGTQWASYSDLFMVLSFIFLLLYVTSSLRNGTNSIQKNMEFRDLTHQVEDLKQQLRAYDTLKEDYLVKGASDREKKDYDGLMDHLKLLQLEAKDEKEALRKQAFENEQKEKALNQYQQMIRNIVNSNMVARARIKKRDTVITEKDETISEKQKDIAAKKREIASQNRKIRGLDKTVKKLETTVDEKQSLIAKNEEKVAKIKEKMKEKIDRLNSDYQKKMVSRKKALAKIAKLKRESEEEVRRLEGQNRIVQSQVSRLNSELDSANTQIVKASEALVRKDKEKRQLQAKFKENLAQAEATYKEKMSQVDQKYSSKLESAKGEYEKLLDDQKKNYKKRSKSLRRKHAKTLNAAKKNYEKLQAKASQEKAALSSKIIQARTNYKKELKDVKSKHSVELAKERAKANARKTLIKQIKKNFAKAGLKANVDAKTGDVILSFGDEYFDTGKHSLKPGMVNILKTFVPAYSKSLFENKKLSEKISAVEIIGFASPTYRGKYVDPTSLNPKDRAAVSYNLDLSYKRAKSIFSHIFDTRKLNYAHQKRLFGLVKVTGRSFLATKNRGIASNVSSKNCASTNCKESQRVIIKFNLKN